MPAPPSVQALPPIPSTTLSQPRSRAARISSPVPRLVAVVAAGRPPGSRRSPDASASSTTAVPSPTARAAATGSPVGPVQRTSWRS